MSRTPLAVLSAVLLGLSAVALAPSADAAATTAHTQRVCAAPAPGSAACLAIRAEAAPAGISPAATQIKGFGPADLRAAYRLGSASSGGKTVAIVDAYDAPKAEADLGVYRRHYGLRPCTTANGCFRKVSQTGSTTLLPQPDAGWASETMLDLDMVSATCPDCKILLVETKDDTFANLAVGARYAGTRHPAAISNSYGGDEYSGVLASAYDQPGIAVTAASGDYGYGVSAPASFPGVIAVGGTSLKKTSAGWTSSAWSGSGSGCSALQPKPAYQSGTNCTRKATADVSAVGDPATGVAMYDSMPYQGYTGWQEFGGTSVSSPVIAAVYAQGTSTGHGTYPGAWTWSHRAALADVSAGSNGTCSTYRWCHSLSGWDGPTGLGTPRGTAAF
jgi:subtilase family serine protease